MQRSVARRTDLRAVFLEDIGPSYALTLRHWRERFGAAAEQLEELGYDDRFRRLWRLYFTLSEAGFLRHACGMPQIVFAKPGAHPLATPTTRPGRDTDLTPTTLRS